MEQKIFNLGLSIDGTSLYLILAALQSEDKPLTMENIKPRWLAPEEKLTESITELKAHQVISTIGENFILRPATEWQKPKHS